MALTGSGLSLRIWYAHSVQMRDWKLRNLAAPYWRWYWNDQPGWQVYLRDQELELRPDYIILIPPECNFWTSSSGQPTHHYIEFSLSGSLRAPDPHFYQIPLKDFGRALVQDMCTAIAEGGIHNELLLQQGLLRSLSMLPDILQAEAQIDQPVERVIQFLQLHLDQRFDSAELSEIAGINADRFPRLFRQQIGEGLQQWHQRQRITAVCFELHHSDKSIEQIADEYGFSDRYHLSKLFKKYRGVGPSSFRKQRYRQQGLA